MAWRSSVDTAASWGLEVQTEWCSAPRTCVHRSPKGSRSFLSTQSESKIQRCNWTVSKNGSAHRNQLQLSGRLLLSSRIDTTPPVWEIWTHPYIVCCGARGDGLLGSGSEPLPHQLGDLGSAVSSPSGVWGRAPAAKLFYHILSTQDGFSWYVSAVFVTEDNITDKLMTVAEIASTLDPSHCRIQFSIVQVKIRMQIGSIATGTVDIFFCQEVRQ